MENTYWRKQDPAKPLFPDLIWSRPEQKSSAGKLLIIGGNLHAFSSPAEAFNYAAKTGAGYVRVLLPSSTKKIVGKILESVEYAPSTPSGSFSRLALAEFMDYAAWADCVLLAGDMGRNSETAILVESFTQKYSGQLAATRDSADYLINTPEIIANRPKSLLVLSFAQLQKLAIKLKFTEAFTFEMDTIRLTKNLSEFTKLFSLMIMVRHQNFTHCAFNGQVTSTPCDDPEEIWRTKSASAAAVWWMQNPTKPLEAITTSLAKID